MKGNLLIVDDEVDLSWSMKELLEDEAHHIYIANNGEEGLAILMSKKIDCVVSDVKMPVMDGFKFIETARKLGLNMPFIFYTGHGSSELKKIAHDLGATDLLTKPNHFNLEIAIRKILSVRLLTAVSTLENFIR
jgi:two-component system nitrogen regulation response regulator NtrX